jgi:HrpA-like RNA helicase
VQSASIDPRQYAEYIGTDFIIEITGRTYPIKTLFLDTLLQHKDIRRDKEDSLVYMAQQAVYQITSAKKGDPIHAAVTEVGAKREGSILLFVPTQQLMFDIAAAVE